MGKKCKCIFWVVKIALIGDQPLAGKCAAFFHSNPDLLPKRAQAKFFTPSAGKFGVGNDAIASFGLKSKGDIWQK